MSLHCPLPPATTPRYVITQIQGGRAIAARHQFKMEHASHPLIISVPRDNTRVGDQIWVNPQTYVELPQKPLIAENLMLSPRATNEQIIDISLPNRLETWGMIIKFTRSGNKKEKKSRITILTYEGEIPQRISPEQMITQPVRCDLGTILKAYIVALPQQARVSKNYFLPVKFPSTEMEEVEIWTHLSWYISELEPCPINAHKLRITGCDPFNVYQAEKVTALALKMYATALKKAVKNTQIVTTVEPVPNLKDDTDEPYLNRWKFQYTPVGKKQTVAFDAIWRRDALVHAYGNKMSANNKWPCGQGQVKMVMYQKDGSFLVILTLVPTNAEKTLEEWEDLTEGHCPSILRVVPPLKRLEERAQVWASHLPSATAQTNTGQGRILASLLNLPNPGKEPVKTTERITANGLDHLNERQKEAAEAFLEPQSGPIVIPAPAGTGKTTLVAAAIPTLLKRAIETCVVMISHTNAAVHETVSDTIPGLPESEKPIILISNVVKQELADLYAPFAQHLLLAAVHERLASLGSPEEEPCPSVSSIRTMNKYVKQCEEQPHLASDPPVMDLLIEEKLVKPRIVYTTVALLEACPSLWPLITHLIVDEATQLPVNQLIALIARFPKLNRLLLIGDDKQLHNYVSDVPPFVRSFGFASAFEHLDYLTVQPPIRITLNETYRFHEELARCLAKAFYDPSFKRAAKADKHEMFITSPLIPLPTRSPILLIHQLDQDSRDKNSFSWINESQQIVAETILEHLLAALPDAQISCLCLYSAQRKRLAQVFRQQPRLRVTTVDRYQSKQADVVMLITTRSLKNHGPETKRALSFVADSRRVCVALSRARAGLVIQGNLTTLRQCRPWRRYLNAALEKTHAVSADQYVQAIRYPELHLPLDSIEF